MNLRIFVIDDEECIRTSFQWHLEDQGHEVLTAPAPEICQIYQGHTCTQDQACGDLLFVDYHLPKMTGLDFVELMEKRGCKGDPRNKVIISGNTTGIDMEKVAKIGCRVIQKPVSLEQVDAIIQEVVPRIDPDRSLADLSA